MAMNQELMQNAKNGRVLPLKFSMLKQLGVGVIICQACFKFHIIGPQLQKKKTQLLRNQDLKQNAPVLLQKKNGRILFSLDLNCQCKNNLASVQLYAKHAIKFHVIGPQLQKENRSLEIKN